MDAGSAAADIREGLRRQGRDWASTAECAGLLARVLRDGTAAEVVAAQRALRRWRVSQAARRALARYERDTAPRGALVQRRLAGRELLEALVRWAERDDAAKREGDRLTVPTRALLRFVAMLGDDPARVVRALAAEGLIEGIGGAELRRVGPALVVRIPREALSDAA